jgi:glycosyltransferase involved in cell wall biosynthesis
VKILFIHNINVYKNDHIGGEEIAFFNEVNAVEKRLGKGNVLTYMAMNKDIKKFSLLFSIWFNIQHYFKVKKLVKKHQIDIVHVHNFFPLLTPSIFYAAKHAGAKTIQTLHNYRKFCLNGTLFYMGGTCTSCPAKSKWYGIKRKCFRNSTAQSIVMTLVQRFYSAINYEKQVDCYFVLSKIEKNLYKEFGTAQEKLFLKPNFIKEHFGYEKNRHKKDYIYVGRLEYQKGVQFLLDFWKQLPRKYVLHVIGLGELEKEINENRWPHIKYLGKKEHNETLKEIAKAKYLIQPSLMYETFSLTTIEAMSVGTPVISFGYGTRKEFVKNGVNGLILTLENFTDVIKESRVYDHYDNLVEGAVKTAKEYSETHVMDMQIKQYEEVTKLL